MATLQEIWLAYKDQVIPVLITAIIGLIPVLFFWVKSKLQTSITKNELVVQNLQQLNKQQATDSQLINTVAGQTVDFTTTVADIKQSLAQLASFIAYAFENSNVSPKLKADLRAMAAEFKTSDIDALNQLAEQITALKDENEAKSQTIAQLEEQAAPTVAKAEEAPSGYTAIER